MPKKNGVNRLLIIVNTAAYNGAMKQLSLWLPFLDPDTWRCCVVFLREEGPMSGKIVPSGATIYSRVLRSRFDPLVLIRIMRISFGFKPHITFTIDERNSMVLGRLAGVLTGSAVIHAIHSTPPPDQAKLSWWNGLTFRFVTRILAITENHQTRLEKIGIPRDRIHCVVNAVPSVEAISVERSSTGNVTATYVGVLRREKRIDMLLEAFAMISNEYQHLRLSIIGSGPLESELKEHARDLEIFDRVEWHGWQQDVTPLLKKTDFLVLPSEPGVETLSMAVLEAMSLGIPVVSTDVGSMSMAVVPETGILIPHGDIKLLAEAIEKMTRDPEMRLHMGEKARLRQRRLFSVDRLRNDMNLFLESMVDR